METPKEPWNFCETPEEKCTMNYCDENGCQNRKRNLVEPKKSKAATFILGQIDKAIEKSNLEQKIEKMETLYRKVADLDLSIRTKNLLRNAGINTLQELTSYTKSDLMKFRNFGRSSLVELEDLMLKNNLSFGTVETIKSDNTQTLENALKEIEKLEADKVELLGMLEEILDGKKDGRTYISMDEIESLIQKHKQ